ncbi:MAG: hypothetical protein KAG99_10040, partial [Bacteroidales bacterium]|nr:hypothetical protein [Bacteroidales bacterium]
MKLIKTTILLFLVIGMSSIVYGQTKLINPIASPESDDIMFSKIQEQRKTVISNQKDLVDLIMYDALVAGADYLRHAQADVTEDNAGNGNPDIDPQDGGWNWVLISPIFTHSAANSSTNLYGATPQGLHNAYLSSADATYLTAMQDAATVMIGNPNIRSAADLIFLMKFQDLPGITPDIYKDAAKAKFDS